MSQASMSWQKHAPPRSFVSYCRPISRKLVVCICSLHQRLRPETCFALHVGRSFSPLSPALRPFRSWSQLALPRALFRISWSYFVRASVESSAAGSSASPGLSHSHTQSVLPVCRGVSTAHNPEHMYEPTYKRPDVTRRRRIPAHI